jgi:DNA-binding NtrC family response regulator
MISSLFMEPIMQGRTDLTEVERLTKSMLMQDILNKVLLLAKTNNPVIIIGEDGAGKKRLAEIIHKNSARASQPFYSFYCVDVKEEEYKEAFREHLQLDEEYLILKYNALEEACGGSLYLDQFSELPPEFMVNIIQSFVKGCQQLYRHNVTDKPRLLITMNTEPWQHMLHTLAWDNILQLIDPVAVMLPPLRERKEDLPLLINYFLRDIKREREGWEKLKISPRALMECLDYNWPGNIRQLKNALLQGAILSHGKTIKRQHLPFSMSWKLPYTLGENERNLKNEI